MSDEYLIAISQFRCLGRFPVLSYYHKSKKVKFTVCLIFLYIQLSNHRLCYFEVANQWWEPIRSDAKKTSD